MLRFQKAEETLEVSSDSGSITVNVGKVSKEYFYQPIYLCLNHLLKVAVFLFEKGTC